MCGFFCFARLMTSLPERGEAPRSDSLCKEDTATAVASSSSSQHKIAAPSTQSPPSYLAPSLPRLPSLRASRTRRRCVRRSHQSPPQDPTFGQGFLGDLWAAAPCGVFSGAPRFWPPVMCGSLANATRCHLRSRPATRIPKVGMLRF